VGNKAFHSICCSS